MVRLSKCFQKSLASFLICAMLYLAYSSFSDKNHLNTYNIEFNYTCKKNSALFKGSDYIICVQKPQIYFVETSSSEVLNSRQACAIESTARHNPSLPVAVLMTPPEPIDTNNFLLKTLLNISNVQLIRINIADLTQGTPIQKWYLLGQWKKSEWKASHLSDSLRYFLMWKYGGAYLDMDIVTLRSLVNLRNSAVTENWDRVAAGILFFDKGHELMKRCMYDFAENYDYSNFVMNGPGIITKNIRSLCDIQKISKVSGANCNVDILPPESAFPIPYDKFEDYFAPSSVINITKHFNSSYMIHVWNKYSKHSKLRIGSNSLYELAMKEHCPSVYKYAQTLGFV